MMTPYEPTGTDRDNADIRCTLQQLTLAVRKLPECSDAAKLRRIMYRLAAAAQDGVDQLPLARRLAAAAREALEADPWVRVDRLARRLLEICEPMSERRRNPNHEELRKRRAEQEKQWNARRHERQPGDAERSDPPVDDESEDR